MADAGSHGGDSDEDGDDAELLREWSKRLVKWVQQGREAGGNATAPVCCGPALGMHLCPMLRRHPPVLLAIILCRLQSAFRRVEKIERGLEEREAEAEAEGNLDALQQRQVGSSHDGAARIMLTAAPACMCMWTRGRCLAQYQLLLHAGFRSLLFCVHPSTLPHPAPGSYPPRSLTAVPHSAGWPTSWRRFSRPRTSIWWANDLWLLMGGSPAAAAACAQS